jgi:hypothetical protein
MKEKIIKIIIAVIITMLFSILFMLLWNAIITVLFGLTEISFFQAVGLKLLYELIK